MNVLPEMISGPVVETDAQIQRLLLSAETERGPALGVATAGEECCEPAGCSLECNLQG